MHQIEGERSAKRREDRHRREDDLLTQVQETIEHLKSEHEIITQASISKIIGISVRRLRIYSRIGEVLDKVVEDAPHRRRQHFLKRDLDFINRIDTAIKYLQEHGESVTQESVARTLNVTVRVLLHSEKVKLFLDQEISKAKLMQFKQNEKEILKLVEDAIHQIETQKECVSVRAVAAKCQMAKDTLLYYPQVAAVLKQAVKDGSDDFIKTERDVSLIKKTIQDLISSGVTLNYQALSEATGISAKVLRRRGPVREVIEEAIAGRSTGN